MPDGIDLPWIVGFVADLMFQTRIEPVAQGLGYQVAWIGSRADLQRTARPLPAGGESGTAEELALLDRVTRLTPALIIFDLNNPDLPVIAWISALKTSPATRRIPLIGYGSHVQADVLQAAKRNGAQAVLARSAFAEKLAELIQKHAVLVDYAALAANCAEPIDPTAVRGIELFNAGEYFEAHELLEEAWNHCPPPGKELYRAILQVAVAYLHVERLNYPGAIKMLLRARQWLNPLPGECRGVNIARLRADAESVYQALIESVPGGLERFDPQLLRPVEFHDTNRSKM